MTANDAIEEVHFSTAEDFFNVLTPTNPRWRGLFAESWIFRGQRDAAWKLVPSALRNPMWVASADPKTLDWMRTVAEFNAIQDFMRVADRAGLAIPEDSQALRAHEETAAIIQQQAGKSGAGPALHWPPRSMLSIVALAQHHRIPTRLLDWSWRPKVAAYFSVCDLARFPERFAGPGRSVVCALSKVFMEFAWVSDSDKPIVTAPQATNPNLAAQAGLFTVVRDRHENVGLEDVIIEKLRTQKPDYGPLPVLVRLTLPHGQAGRLLRLLARDGVSAATVWPNYDGVAQALVEESFHRE